MNEITKHFNGNIVMLTFECFIEIALACNVDANLLHQHECVLT